MIDPSDFAHALARELFGGPEPSFDDIRRAARRRLLNAECDDPQGLHQAVNAMTPNNPDTKEELTMTKLPDPGLESTQAGFLPRMSERELERYQQDRGASKARVVAGDLDAAVSGVQHHVFPGTTLTVCCLTLKNGYCIVGESACADPGNFDRQLGERLAFDNARNKLWPLLGYALRDRLHRDTLDSDMANSL